MPKNLKKQKRKAERKAQRKLDKLEEGSLDTGQKIPRSTATALSLPDDLSHLDGQNYQLIFDHYNHKACELSRLDKKTAKLLVNKLNRITKTNNPATITALFKSSIHDSGDYTDLYEGLEKSIELSEIQYGDEGRIICYCFHGYLHKNKTKSNYCCIVAILVKHRRT